MKAEETGSPKEARLRVGNIGALKEACRDIWTFSTIESFWKDFRYGLRALANRPGDGPSTAVFTIVNAALSYDLGVDQPERLVLVSVADQARRISISHSYLDFLNLRNQVKSVESLAAYRFIPVNVSE